MSCKIQVGDIGTILQVLFTDCDGVAVNISTATTMKIILKSPHGTVTSNTATFDTDGSDGMLNYTSIADTFNVAGNAWSIQGYIEMPTWSGHSSTNTFVVHENLTQ